VIRAPRLDAAAVQPLLETRWLGRAWHWRGRTASTNDLARSLAERDAAAGTVVVADTQSRGRGRRGHAWRSPRGGLWLSVVLRPTTPAAELGPLGLAVAVAVAETVEALGTRQVELKWPNDVLVAGGKVAGILTEAAAEGGRVRHVVVGIGVNLNVTRFPPALCDRAASIHRELGVAVDRAAFAADLCRRLELWVDRFEREGAAPVLAAWRARGRLGPVTVVSATTTIEGVAIGLDADGALLVRRVDGVLEPVRSGEVV